MTAPEPGTIRTTTGPHAAPGSRTNPEPGTRRATAAGRALAVVTATALTVPLLLGATTPPAPVAGDPAKNAKNLARLLVRDSTAQGAYRHLRMFQAIADSSDGHRAAGTLGHDASAAYVYRQLKEAGYQVSYDTFDFTYTETLAEKLSVAPPRSLDLTVKAMTYTASTPEGGIKAPLVAVPTDATTGCEAADYTAATTPTPTTARTVRAAGSVKGAIALIKRGGCPFAQKQAAAATAGAVGALIYNNADGDLSGTLGSPEAGRVPTGGLSRAAGEKLLTELADGPVTVALEIRERRERRTTRNVVAETRGGDPARTVMLGAHLDSVAEGPGINDNGSGSAGLLEVALRLAGAGAVPAPAHKVRFAWWSAEENGLKGSEAFVRKLTADQRKRIALYLNFDMVASPNAAQFVLRGGATGPKGSDRLERDIGDFLDRRGTPHEGTAFDGRSDYGPFVEAGIPSGGTDTGAEGVKTTTQAKVYGGTAGKAYDPCYHAACDKLDNLDLTSLETNIDVMANALGTYAHELPFPPR
ncbi:M28 family peptidase [Streptomyces sp. DT24]|uniref:M28 family peptidase n=1 Tax=Streptomyces sp. DT24 TaxID=3416520 RepID=UPI003CFA9098